MKIFNLGREWVYISGRVAALTSRPLMLLALKHWGGNDLAATVAVVFLVVMLASAISAFDTHRGFYQVYFSDQSVRGVRAIYRVYCGACTLQVAVVSPLLACFMLYRFGDPVLAVLVAAYFASERLADELQRFLIFSSQRQEWGARIIAKAVLQLAGISGAVALLGPASVHAALGVLLAGNMAAYGAKVPWRYLAAGLQNWRAAVAACVNQRIFWLLSMITTVISYLDRIVVMLFQQSDMAVYTILISSMSIVQNAVEYFFMSLRRRDILQGQLSLAGVFQDRRFYLLLSIAAMAGVGASWAMLYFYYGKQIVHLELLPIVLVIQVALSITMVVREIIYWNHSVRLLVCLEGGFIICSLAAAAALRASGLNYEAILGMISAFYTLRMGLMIWGIWRANNLARTT